jgi:iron(III) transport system permease protein
MQAKVIKNQPPLLLVATASAIAIAVLMPLTYLVMRTASISGEQLLIISRPRTLQVLLNSAGIAIATPLFSAAIAVPLAFLTWRTDLSRRRFWLIATTLPLAIPDGSIGVSGRWNGQKQTARMLTDKQKLGSDAQP